jgi:ACS family D-galactonate transporter-like MFS transporter
VIGLLVNEGDFKPALVFIASLAVIGACSYLFFVEKIERVELKKETNTNTISIA